MNYTIKNTDGKMLFVFECEMNEPMVTALFNAIQSQQMPTRAIIPKQEFPASTPKASTSKKHKVKSEKDREAAVLAEKIADFDRRHQLLIPFPESNTETAITATMIAEEIKSEVPSETDISILIDVNLDTEDRQTMDVDTLQIMLTNNTPDAKLEAIKYVKDKTGLDLPSSKEYCDNLWKKHLNK